MSPRRCFFVSGVATCREMWRTGNANDYDVRGDCSADRCLREGAASSHEVRIRLGIGDVEIGSRRGGDGWRRR